MSFLVGEFQRNVLTAVAVLGEDRAHGLQVRKYLEERQNGKEVSPPEVIASLTRLVNLKALERFRKEDCKRTFYRLTKDGERMLAPKESSKSLKGHRPAFG